ncbi:MHYT domain-containing protein [Streptomyces sp. NPDC005917]|uniref:MHYT domain-containing protein n=1 Tax=Streptomyces sp. NPDC005917 TaxID=3155347 RepID=UPI0033D3FF1E
MAAMHYLGMAALRLDGTIRYDRVTVALSVLIAIAAATAALWAAVSVRGFTASLGASLVMGLAVSGMHFTAMAAVSVDVHPASVTSWSSVSPTSLLLPMVLGPAVFLLLAGVVVMSDALLVLGEGDWNRQAAGKDRPATPPRAARSRPPGPRAGRTREPARPSDAAGTGRRGPALHGVAHRTRRPAPVRRPGTPGARRHRPARLPHPTREPVRRPLQPLRMVTRPERRQPPVLTRSLIIATVPACLTPHARPQKAPAGARPSAAPIAG